MKVLIPIDNFIIEDNFELGGCHFFSGKKLNFSGMKVEKLLPEGALSIEGSFSCSLRDFQNMITGITLEDMSGMTLVSTQLDWPDEGYHTNSREDDKALILKACKQVDRVMDYIRVINCRLDVPMSNPGLPGLLDNGFSGVVLINPRDYSRYRIASSRFYGLSMVNGLGLQLSSTEIEGLLNKSDFSIVFDSMDFYSTKLCVLALRRLSEAMYIPHLDSKFIYLMTTLETIASPDYIGFEKIKSRILPFIAKTTNGYHSLAKELRVFSQDIRTEIVHNGKSLTDVRKNDYNQILLRLQSYIADFVTGVESTKCKTREELEVFRIDKLKELGIIK